jgi:long-chain acyl-CoA synthetase
MNTSEVNKTGYPSIDKPWLKYYKKDLNGKTSDDFISIPSCSIYDHLFSRTKPYLDEVALDYLGTKISYKQLHQNIEKTAKALKAIGVERGQIVSVCLPNIPEAVYLFYAINRIGAVSNMLDLRCASKWLKTALNDAHSEVLICLDLVSEKFNEFLSDTEVKTTISVSSIESLPTIKRDIAKLTHKELNPSVPVSFIPWSKFINNGKRYSGDIDVEFEENADAVIAYTGGTTGDPKGVVGTNETINAQFLSQLEFGHNCTMRDRMLALAPPWTYYGLCNSLNNYLCIGACVVLIPKTDPTEFGNLIKSTKANFIITVPSWLNVLLSDKSIENLDLSFVKALVVGADKLDETLEENVNMFLHSHGCTTNVSKGYGMTEVMAAAACSSDDGVIGSVGIPTPGIIISAFTENTEGTISECKLGETGEIAILSPCIMKTYFGAAQSENSEIKKLHSDGKIWAHTGDLGYIGEDGRVYIVGRKKRMFVRNGYKVFPATIEKALSKHPSVSQAAVVSVPDKEHGNITKAVIVLNKPATDTEPIENELQAMLTEELYDYELPDIYIFDKALPLTPMGKVDYNALEKM